MQNFNFKLQTYTGPATKIKCPSCGQRTFTRYIGSDGNILSDIVGRCDRENSCGYHYTPSLFFAENPDKRGSQSEFSPVIQPIDTKPISYLPFDVMYKSVSMHRHSCFYRFLSSKFRNDIASDLCNQFLIGTNRAGNTVFWQVDIDGRIRQAKVMQYSPITGKRNKDFTTHFAGKNILNNKEANLSQCFFGEYQLSFSENSNKKIALVESEKTAVIASVYYPDYVWLATGGKHGARWTEATTCKVLKDRDVVLFPDVLAYQEWKIKGELISKVAGCSVRVSDLLYTNATGSLRAQDSDIADYLLANTDSSGLALTDSNYPVIWDYIN